MSKRSGFVAIIGLPNAGKSTLLNTLIKQKLSIVSPRPQTTRYRIEGIYQSENSQIVFVDTPGFIRSDKGLEHILEKEIEAAIDNSDLILFIIEPINIDEFARYPSGLFEAFKKKVMESKKPVVIALNKIDTIKKEKIIILKEDIRSRDLSGTIVEISALTGDNIDRLIKTIEEYMPEGEFLYNPDYVTVKSERFLCQEFIREQIFYTLQNEVPYECAVNIEEFDESDRYNEDVNRQIVRIKAVIIVSRESLKPIVIGKNGSMIKKIGIGARKSMEDLLGCKTFLELKVIVKKNWTRDRFFLSELGYEKV